MAIRAPDGANNAIKTKPTTLWIIVKQTRWLIPIKFVRPPFTASDPMKVCKDRNIKTWWRLLSFDINHVSHILYTYRCTISYYEALTKLTSRGTLQGGLTNNVQAFGIQSMKLFCSIYVTNQNAKELAIKYFKHIHSTFNIFTKCNTTSSILGFWCFRIYSFLNAGIMPLKNVEYNYRNAVLIMKKFCRDNPSERLGYQKVGQITFQITCHHLSPNLKPTPNISSSNVQVTLTPI